MNDIQSGTPPEAAPPAVPADSKPPAGPTKTVIPFRQRFLRFPGRQGGPQPQRAPEQGALRKGNVRVYPLGGFEQVGRNCFVIEVDGDIYIIDLGLQFPE